MPGQLGLAAAPASFALLGQGQLEAGSIDRHPVFGRQLDGQVDRKAIRVVEPEGRLAGEERGIGGQLLGPPADDPLRPGQRDQGLLEVDRPGIEGPGELGLLTGDRPEDRLAPLDQVRIGLPHRLDHDLGRLDQERLGPAEQPAVADGPPDDPAEDVAAAFVRGQDSVGDQEGDRPGVVGDHLVAEALRLEGVRVMAEQLPHPGMDRGEQVGVEVARDLLEDACQPFQAHPRVDAGERQGNPAGRPLVELHEDEVPDLEPARAGLGVVRDAARPLGELGAPIEVDLAARPARTRLGHPPEVAVVAGLDVAPDGHPIRRQADLVAPDRPGHLIVLVGRGRQPVGRDRHVDRQEVPGEVDRLALEVIPEAPVAEHLEEGVVAGRPADLLEVVVLAGDAQDPLVVDRPGVAPLLGAGQDVLELDHPGVREQEGLVAGRDEAGRGDRRMTALLEELDETAPDLRRTQRADPGIARPGGFEGSHNEAMVPNGQVQAAVRRS